MTTLLANMLVPALPKPEGQPLSDQEFTDNIKLENALVDVNKQYKLDLRKLGKKVNPDLKVMSKIYPYKGIGLGMVSTAHEAGKALCQIVPTRHAAPGTVTKGSRRHRKGGRPGTRCIFVPSSNQITQQVRNVCLGVLRRKYKLHLKGNLHWQAYNSSRCNFVNKFGRLLVEEMESEMSMRMRPWLCDQGLASVIA